MSTTATITLDFPLNRGENQVTSITLSKPNAGALRGVSLRELLDMNTDAITAVVPRISVPQITPQEMPLIDPCDLLKMGAALANFCLPPSLVQEAAAQLSLTE